MDHAPHTHATEEDPFLREDFRDRLGKLLRLLATDHEAEAEAARRKLLQHLAHHGVSLNDLTAHLGEVHEHGHGVPLEAMRHAAAQAQRAEAAHRAAEEMNTRLLRTLEATRAEARTARMAAWALGGLLVVVAGVGVGIRVWPVRTNTASVQQISPRVSDMVAPPPPRVAAAPPAAEGAAGARQPGEWIGTIQQGAELLDEPDSAAQRRAMLDNGARVLVLQSGPVWLRVRTERGDGYVLKGLVRADR